MELPATRTLPVFALVVADLVDTPARDSPELLEALGTPIRRVLPEHQPLDLLQVAQVA